LRKRSYCRTLIEASPSKHWLHSADGTTGSEGCLLHPRCERSNPLAIRRQHAGASAAIDELEARDASSAATAAIVTRSTLSSRAAVADSVYSRASAAKCRKSS
jgi:hypothetical protein